MATYKPTLLLIAVISMLSACGGGSELRDPKATDPEFEGLDPAIVEETLAMPYYLEGANPSDYETQRDYNLEAASYAYVVEVCRGYNDAYVEWAQTSQAPSAPEPPATPNTGISFSLAEDGPPLLEEDDPDQLLEWVAGEDSCGYWVPATPGSNTTIRKQHFPDAADQQ